MIKIGFCADMHYPEQVRAIAAAGSEFVELNLCAVASASERELADTAALLRELHLPCLSFNCMLPGDLRINGSGKDLARADHFLARALRRAVALGGENIVFGSSRSRAPEENATRASAFSETAVFLREHVAPACALAGIGCTVEPLSECSLIHTVADGLSLVRAADRPEIGLLIDFYHTAVNGEDMRDLSPFAACLRHTHLAACTARTYPRRTDPDDYAAIFRSLSRIGYRGGLSIEAIPPKPEEDFASVVREAYQTVAAAREQAAKEA